MITKTTGYSIYNTRYPVQQQKKDKSNIVFFKAELNGKDLLEKTLLENKSQKAMIATLREQLGATNLQIAQLYKELNIANDTNLSLKLKVQSSEERIKELEQELDEIDKMLNPWELIKSLFKKSK